MEHEQMDALQLADWCEGNRSVHGHSESVAKELRRLHARNQELESRRSADTAGALFDFAGYLTTLPAKAAFPVGSHHSAEPMVEALKAWAKTRALSLESADVVGWDEGKKTAPPAAAREFSFTEREEFEAWWMLSPMTSNKRPARLPDGQYANSLADHAWNGWQGRAAATIDLTEGMLEKVAAPDGWKLVPVEVTPEMEAAYYDPRKGVGAAAEWGAMLDAAPNVDAPMMGMAPPATAPVVLPEPFALYDGEKWYANEEAAICSCATIEKLQKVFTEQQVRELLAQATCHQAQPVKQEPFAYFKPFVDGWMDCKETDEGARPLYEAPQPQAELQQSATGEPVGYMNEGHIHELAMKRLPYGYVYPEAGAGASTAVYTHTAPSVPDDVARDAERYRWLRNCDVETRDNGDVFVGCAKGKIVLNGADLDAIVGAAITAAKGE